MTDDQKNMDWVIIIFSFIISALCFIYAVLKQKKRGGLATAIINQSESTSQEVKPNVIR